MRPLARSSAFAVFLFVVAAATPAAQQATVTGQIEVFKSPGQSQDSSGAVVWLTRIGDSTQTPSDAGKQRYELLQKRRSFSPHLLVVPVGSSVEFPNQDPFFHNVFSLFEGKRFDLGLYESGSSRSVTFNRAGVSYIFCNIHQEMSAVVISLNTPYYGTSDRKGTIFISNVPYGRYQMQVWHERVLPETLTSLTRTLDVSETSASFGLLGLPEQRSPSQASHKNKYGHDYDKRSPDFPVYTRP